MPRAYCESSVRVLVEQVWDQEIRWPHIEAWLSNFVGETGDMQSEQLHAFFALSRFMYFGKRLIREMLRSLYREHFRSPLMQRIRRHLGGTTDVSAIGKIYAQELATTRFIGIGNPAESAAHLLYYFRQVNRLPKDLFVDWNGAFLPAVDSKAKTVTYRPRHASISRYVFFDDLVGSADQATRYVGPHLRNIRMFQSGVDLRFMCLFATTEGLEKMNSKALFDGKAMCLFELDESYKACGDNCRHFFNAPAWFDPSIFKVIARVYGAKLQPKMPFGYRDGQLLLGFSHNTPDNTLPVFWDEGQIESWEPAFVRFDKLYGATL